MLAIDGSTLLIICDSVIGCYYFGLDDDWQHARTAGFVFAFLGSHSTSTVLMDYDMIGADVVRQPKSIVLRPKSTSHFVI
jgi:hypothetical protein